MEDDFVTVATHRSLAEAEAERLALEAEGIRTFSVDDAGTAGLWPNVVGDYELQVAPADAAMASDLLTKLRAESQVAAETAGVSGEVSLTCPQCKREIWFPADRRGHVEVCPECGSYVDVPEAGSDTETVEDDAEYGEEE